MQSYSGAVVVTVLAPSSGPLLENDEHRRQRLMNICGPTAGVSPGPSPCGESNWQTRGAAEGSEDRGRRTPRSVSSPGWQELDSSGLGSAGRTDGQGFSTASRAAKRQTCLPSLCQPTLRFPPGPSQQQRLKPEDPDSWARTMPFPAHRGGQDEGQRVQGFLRQQGGRTWAERLTRFTFPCAGRASLQRSNLSPYSLGARDSNHGDGSPFVWQKPGAVLPHVLVSHRKDGHGVRGVKGNPGISLKSQHYASKERRVLTETRNTMRG